MTYLPQNDHHEVSGNAYLDDGKPPISFLISISPPVQYMPKGVRHKTVCADIKSSQDCLDLFGRSSYQAVVGHYCSCRAIYP